MLNAKILDKILTATKPTLKYKEGSNTYYYFTKKGMFGNRTILVTDTVHSLKDLIVLETKDSIKGEIEYDRTVLNTLEIDVSDLKWLTLAAATKDAPRWYLNSLYWNGLELTDKVLASSDGHRIHAIGLNKYSDLSQNYVIPLDFLEIAIKFAKIDNKKSLRFVFFKPTIKGCREYPVECDFSFGRICSHTYSNKYPNISALYPAYEVEPLGQQFNGAELKKLCKEISSALKGYNGCDLYLKFNAMIKHAWPFISIKFGAKEKDKHLPIKVVRELNCDLAKNPVRVGDGYSHFERGKTSANFVLDYVLDALSVEGGFDSYGVHSDNVETNIILFEKNTALYKKTALIMPCRVDYEV